MLIKSIEPVNDGLNIFVINVLLKYFKTIYLPSLQYRSVHAEYIYEGGKAFHLRERTNEQLDLSIYSCHCVRGHARADGDLNPAEPLHSHSWR